MDDFELSIYIREILHQCELIEVAEIKLREVVNNPSSGSVQEAFLLVQAWLTSAGMINRMIWPSSKRPDDLCKQPNGKALEEQKRALLRGGELRKCLVRKGDFILLGKSRAVRNSFEHFDERLDEFIEAERNQGLNIIDRNISSTNGIVVNGVPAKHLRRIDPQTYSIHILEDSISIFELMKEVTMLKDRIKLWLDEYEMSRRTDDVA